MKSSPTMFQMVITGIFAVLLVLGFLGFSGKIPLPIKKGDINYGEVVLWGTLPSRDMQSVIGASLSGNKKLSIKYIEKNETSFDRDFVEALATGKGPDLVLLPQEGLMKNLNKLSTVSYQAITERDFKNTFLQEGEMFLFPEGIIAFPFTLDPMVMYWNRDIFTNAAVLSPPTLWKQFYDLAPKMTVRGAEGSISRSFVPFGGYRNVTNAKGILSVFMLQAGSPIVSRSNGVFSASVINSGTTSRNEDPVVSAVRFFTEFSKKDKDSYSWNSSLPESRSMFEAGDLAVYFGYASEHQLIKKKNPHLNFDVALVPQAEGAPIKVTFGRMHGLAIPAASKNSQGAFQAILVLIGQKAIGDASSLLSLPPVRRDLFSSRPTDPAMSVFYDSAVLSKGWYDISSEDTDMLFKGMIDDVASDKLSMSQALGVLQEGMTRLLRLKQQ